MLSQALTGMWPAQQAMRFRSCFAAADRLFAQRAISRFCKNKFLLQENLVFVKAFPLGTVDMALDLLA